MSQTKVLPDVVDENGARVICPTLHHTGTQTPRKDEMIRWYRNVLGQQPTLEAQPPAAVWDSTWTSNDWAHHRMGFFAVPGLDIEITPTSPGIQHVAWEYDGIDDLLESWERIKALGIEPQFCVNHLVSFAFYYRDPDGNLVELLADGYGDHEKSLEVQRTSEVMRANPPGTPVDPAKLLAARRNGMSLEELHERSYAGEMKPEVSRVHDLDPERLDENWKKTRDLE